MLSVYNFFFIEEMAAWYSIQMLVENTSGNNKRKMNIHFQKIVNEYGGVRRMGFDRFVNIRRALCPSNLEIQELCGLLETTWKANITKVILLLSFKFNKL